MPHGILFDGVWHGQGDLIIVPPSATPARTANGGLSPLPRILLVLHNDEKDAYQLEPISYAVAAAGWPDKLKAKWPATTVQVSLADAALVAKRRSEG